MWRAYHLLTGDNVIGHLYYATAENALLPYEIEAEVACIYCTELLSEFRNKGYGTRMLEYVKEELTNQGVNGIVVVATEFNEYMHYTPFLKLGFTILHEQESFKLMYFPLTKKRIAVRPLELKYSPSSEPGSA